MVCVGISSYRGNLDEAKAEARNVALEEVANALAVKMESEVYENHVRPLYSDARGSLLDQYTQNQADRESEGYIRVHDQIADVRRRAAEALMASSGDAMPRQHAELWWEQYDEGDNAEYLVFTRFDINMDAVRRMASIYGLEEEVGGGKAVTGAPLLAWGYSDFDGGVVVTDPSGSLNGAGEHGVVIAVGDQQIKNVRGLADALANGGGKLNLATPATVEGGPK